MRKLIVAGLAVGLFTSVAGIPGLSAQVEKQERRQAVVVCFNGPIRHFWATPVLRTRPRKCNFTYRSVPHPYGAATEEMNHLHWRTWNHRHAHGTGRVFFTGGHSRADVFLFGAVNQCGGRRVFSKARFEIHRRDHPSPFTMPLRTCT